jgi:hypothetical protein
MFYILHDRDKFGPTLMLKTMAVYIAFFWLASVVVEGTEQHTHF